MTPPVPEDEDIHGFAFDVFRATTDIAVDLGLHGAGQDLLSDASSGNMQGMGPGYAGLEFTERVSELVLCFLADKTEPGAWNLPLFCMFADPFTTPGLVIDPKMHAGFRFEVHDLVEGKRAFFDCPGEMYDLLLYIGAPSSCVIKEVTSRALGEPAAATSTQRLGLHGWPLCGQGRPGDDRALPVGPPGGRRGARAVRLPARGRRVHARLPPRPAHPGGVG